MVIRTSLFLLAFSCLFHQALAQEEFPTRLIGFLKPGQHVGLSSRPENAVVLVFKNKTDMEIHRDAEKLSVGELRKKFPQVERQAKEVLATATDANSDAKKDQNSPKLEIGRYAPLRYAKVVHVGEDFVLIEYANGYRTAYSERQISRVAWDDGKPNLCLLYTSPSPRDS